MVFLHVLWYGYLWKNINYNKFPLDRFPDEIEPSLDMEIDHLGLLVSRLCPLSVILTTTHQVRKLDLFPSSGERMGNAPIQLGRIEKAILMHWTVIRTL
jgi:hypothetical protein